mmetsp:Transcript_130634/g.194605  ORF Transcript_130634/g.194605 Transcript_130634/m.194605 type:complete len:508 (-) Transcript_130634:1358-2881(-)
MLEEVLDEGRDRLLQLLDGVRLLLRTGLSVEDGVDEALPVREQHAVVLVVVVELLALLGEEVVERLEDHLVLVLRVLLVQDHELREMRHKQVQRPLVRQIHLLQRLHEVGQRRTDRLVRELHERQRAPLDLGAEDGAPAHHLRQEPHHAHEVEHARDDQEDHHEHLSRVGAIDRVVHGSGGGEGVNRKAFDPVAHAILVAAEEVDVRQRGPGQAEEDDDRDPEVHRQDVGARADLHRVHVAKHSAARHAQVEADHRDERGGGDPDPDGVAATVVGVVLGGRLEEGDDEEHDPHEVPERVVEARELIVGERPAIEHSKHVAVGLRERQLGSLHSRSAVLRQVLVRVKGRDDRRHHCGHEAADGKHHPRGVHVLHLQALADPLAELGDREQDVGDRTQPEDHARKPLPVLVVDRLITIKHHATHRRLAVRVDIEDQEREQHEEERDGTKGRRAHGAVPLRRALARVQDEADHVQEEEDDKHHGRDDCEGVEVGLGRLEVRANWAHLHHA